VRPRANRFIPTLDRSHKSTLWDINPGSQVGVWERTADSQAENSSVSGCRPYRAIFMCVLSANVRQLCMEHF